MPSNFFSHCVRLGTVSFILCQCASQAPVPVVSEASAAATKKHLDLYEDQGKWPGACQRALDPAQRQSPIALSDSLFGKAKPSPIAFHYRPADAEIIDNGHTIQYKFKTDAGYLEFERKKYFIKQFHFHKASEHTLNGKSFPMEVHFVHMKETKAGENPAAVALGFLIDSGKADADWKKVWQMLPAKAEKPVHGESLAHGDKVLAQAAQINIRGLIPKASKYMAYQGSLTTPGCDEIVTHVLAEKPIPLDPEQIAKFASYHAISNRQLQPVGDAKVRKFRLVSEK